MKIIIHPDEKVIFHVDEHEFEDFAEADELMKFYGKFNVKFEFWIEYREVENGIKEDIKKIG